MKDLADDEAAHFIDATAECPSCCAVVEFQGYSDEVEITCQECGALFIVKIEPPEPYDPND